MTEKFLISHRPIREMLLQKRPERLRFALLGFGRGQVRQRRLKFREIVASQLAVDPRRPFFFKRFHRGPSGGFAVFFWRRKAGTSPCRSSSPVLPQFRGIA